MTEKSKALDAIQMKLPTREIVIFRNERQSTGIFDPRSSLRLPLRVRSRSRVCNGLTSYRLIKSGAIKLCKGDGRGVFPLIINYRFVSIKGETCFLRIEKRSTRKGVNSMKLRQEWKHFL